MTYFLIIDVETGGLDPSVHALLSIGAVLVKKEQDDLSLISSFYVPVYPTREVTLDALRVNKIRIEDHIANSLPPEKAYQRFITWMTSYLSKQDYPIVVGWNVRFDLGFIEQWMNDNNDSLRNYASYRALDIQSVVSFLIETGHIPETARGGLASAAKYFGIDTVHHHHALVDAAMAHAVFHALWRYMKRLRKLKK